MSDQHGELPPRQRIHQLSEPPDPEIGVHEKGPVSPLDEVEDLPAGTPDRDDAVIHLLKCKTVKGVFSVVDEGGARLDHLIEALAKKANHDLVDEDLLGCNPESTLLPGLRLRSREKITERGFDIVVVHGNRCSSAVADFVNSTTFQQGGTDVSVEEADHERKCWLEFTQVLCYYIHGAMSSFPI